MYKFINKKKINTINILEKEYCILSNFLIKNNFNYWWFFEISRLDFRPWGGLDINNFIKIEFKLVNFIIKLFKDFLFIILFIFKGLFYKKRKIFFKNIFIQEKIFLDKKVKDFYFNGIFNKTKNKQRLYVSINKNNEKTLDLNSLLNFEDRTKAFFLSLRSKLEMYLYLKKLTKQKKISKFWCQYFFLKSNFKNLYINHLVFNFFLSNRICKNLIFPYEEKTFERVLMMALKNSKKNIETKAYGICINPQHILSSFLKRFKELNIPRTNKYLFCGPFYRNYFSKLKRENYLSKNKVDCIGSIKSKIFRNKYNKGNSVMIVLSHIDEFYTLTKYFKKEKKLLQFDYIVRPYPHADDTKKILDYITKNNLNNIRLSKRNLRQDVKESFAVLFSGTSAGIEAINCGSVGIWSNLSNIGMNPLFDNVSLFFPNFNSSQLLKKIDKIFKMSNSSFNNHLKKQQNFCQNIYSKINLEIIDKYLNK